MSMDSAIVLALISIIAAAMVSLFKLLDNNTKALQSLSETNDRMAKESEKRNGHLAEISIENKEQIINRIDGMVIQKQTVHNQTVKHEHVESKE